MGFRALTFTFLYVLAQKKHLRVLCPRTSDVCGLGDF
jgi:hypothetical protein